jgi:hypothetical protein
MYGRAAWECVRALSVRKDAEKPAKRARTTSTQVDLDFMRSYVHRLMRELKAGRRPRESVWEELDKYTMLVARVPVGVVSAVDGDLLGGGGGNARSNSATIDQLFGMLDGLMRTLDEFDSVEYSPGKTYSRTDEQKELHRRMCAALALRLFGKRYLEQALPRLRTIFPDIDTVNEWMCISAPRRSGKTMGFCLFAAGMLLNIEGWRSLLVTTNVNLTEIDRNTILTIIGNAGYGRHILYCNRRELIVRTRSSLSCTVMLFPSSQPRQ